MDSNVKSLIITGTAAEDATKFRQKGSRKRRIIKDEEDSEFIENVKRIIPPQAHVQAQLQPQVQLQARPQISLLQVQATASPRPQAMASPTLMTTQQPNPQVQAMATTKSPSVAQVTRETSVILKPLKQARVKLQPKLSSGASTSPATDTTTRKARRIHLSVGNLTHRFTRAKRVKDDTEKKPMETIREYLINKGVIQQKSKAPEKMLRSMYSDFMLLKDQAL
jgi:hypothetical protein